MSLSARWTAPLLALAATLGPLGCAAADATDGDDDAAEVDAADLTQSTAKTLRVPLALLQATFFIKPTSIDQSGLGVVLAPNIAFGSGAGGGSRLTSVDGKPFAGFMTADVRYARNESVRAVFDYPNLRIDDPQGVRLGTMPVAATLAPEQVTPRKACRVLGTAFDMYATTKPKLKSLAVTIDSVRPAEGGGVMILAKSRTSTGGDMSLLICDDKLAGISDGAGSQGTYHEFHSVDASLLAGFKSTWTSSASECERTARCRR